MNKLKQITLKQPNRKGKSRNTGSEYVDTKELNHDPEESTLITLHNAGSTIGGDRKSSVQETSEQSIDMNLKPTNIRDAYNPQNKTELINQINRLKQPLLARNKTHKTDNQTQTESSSENNSKLPMKES